MIDEEPSKYLEDVKKILELFDEVEKYGELAEKYEPLYHPLLDSAAPRKDVPRSWEHEAPISIYSADGYVIAPPLKGVRKIEEG